MAAYPSGLSVLDELMAYVHFAMRFSTSVMFCLIGPLIAHGQDTTSPTGGTYFGFGVGLEHGGIGVRADLRPIPELSVFGGAGYAFAGIGWNLGFACRLRPGHKVVPYVTAMYGYNTAYVLRNQATRTTIDSELYFGPSFGAGVEFMKKVDAAFWRVGLLFPIRADEVAEEHPEISEKLWPVLFSIGYHFRI